MPSIDRLPPHTAPPAPAWWPPVLFAALAGALGWGIRGQYGHETGAMIAGLLVGLVLALLFCPHWRTLHAARVVAWCTAAFGVGGAMTYGQTIGLTQDSPLVGNWSAFRWGMLGLALKGGLWIGFGGLFLGMGLGGIRYRAREWLALLAAALGLYFLGVHLLNTPFDPSQRLLPALYFSDAWHWEPDADLKPRRETWGGLLFALAGLLLYAVLVRRDRLAGALASWGIAAGAIGFPAGQSLQAFHAWNLHLFSTGPLRELDPLLNWWNLMETTFGAILGGVLGFGTWLHRQAIRPPTDEGSFSLPPVAEALLALLHLALLAGAEFTDLPFISLYTDLSLLLLIVPVAAVACGRWWPYAMILPVTLLPIAGKTVRQMVYREHALPEIAGWLLYLALPMAAALAASGWLARASLSQAPARAPLARVLLGVTWLYFALNFAFFRFPWPWAEWTARTPNALIFLACALALSALAFNRTSRRSPAQGNAA